VTGFEVSSAQRKKIKGMRCLYCGAEAPDPAHVWQRSRGGCDHPDCVVPLCRECHDRYDERLSPRIDILPQLISGRFWVELAHPTLEHRVSPTALVARLCGKDGSDPMEIVKPLLSQLRQHRQATESRLGLIAAASRRAEPGELMMGPDRLLYEVAEEVEHELAANGLLESHP